MDSDINLLQIVVGPDHVPTHSSMRDSSEPDLMGPSDDNSNNDNDGKKERYEMKKRPKSYQGHEAQKASHKLPLPALMQYKFNYLSDHIGSLDSF